MANYLLKELPKDIEETYLPSLFKTYPKLCDTDPSSFLVYKEDGDSVDVKEHFIDVCHAGLISTPPGFTDLITAVPRNKDLDLEYQRLLMLGPFKAFSDLITLDKRGKHYFIHCAQLDKWPANVLYNYCIATRVPIEFDHLLPYWGKLIGDGYEPTLAFLLSYSTAGKDKGKERSYPNSEHFWFDAGSDWSRILSGNPEKMAEESYSQAPKSCKPANVIWGHSEDYGKLRFMRNDEVSQFYGLPIAPFKKPDPPVKKLPKLNKLLPYPQWNFGEPALPGANPQAWQNAVNQIAAQHGHANPAAEIALPAHGEIVLQQFDQEWVINPPPPPMQLGNPNFVWADEEPQPDVEDDDFEFPEPDDFDDEFDA